MELMSPLLLCALAALLPQALGVKSTFISEIKRESPKFIEMPSYHKTLWIKRKTQSEVSLDMVLDYLHETDKCSLCLDCINKALFFFSSKKSTASVPAIHMPNRDFILNDIIENYHHYKEVRNKRNTEVPRKPKKSYVSKSKNVTVTKYTSNIDGQIYAIKLRERNSTQPENQGDSSCQVFSVRKNYPCESPKAELIFTNARRKVNKPNRRSKKQTKSMLTTDKPQSQSLVFRDKLLAEPFMTSIEELYN